MTDSQEFRLVRDRGSLNGFSNLYRKELVPWWGSRFWWKSLLRWTLLTNGFFAFIAFVTSHQPPSPGQTLLDLEMTTFFGFVFMVTSIAVIIQSQGSIIGERQAGTAAWVLSKPVARTAFIVAKFAAGAVGFISFLTVQAVVAYWHLGLWVGPLPSPIGFFEACGLWMLNILFYLALTLMLGTFLRTRGAIAGSGIGLLILGKNLGAIPLLAHVGPFRLMTVAPLLALGQPVQPGPQMLVMTTVLEIILMVWIAAARFADQEL